MEEEEEKQERRDGMGRDGAVLKILIICSNWTDAAVKKV